RARDDDQIAPLLKRRQVEGGFFGTPEANKRDCIMLAQMLDQVVGAAAPAARWRIGHIRRQHQNVWLGHGAFPSSTLPGQCSRLPEATSSARIRCLRLATSV